VELENASTKKRYVFHCGRWLAKNEDDGSTVREMPAEGEDIKKPQPGDGDRVMCYTSSYG